ncbi:MAG: HAD-IA family hydrolase [Nanoarchaeota archaeon]|nr:HAD-IA family hydrolase [Nanoarchaeota archaeon]
MIKEEKSKNEIKAIVFDIGGVLLKEQGSELRKYLAKRYDFDSKKFSEFWMKNLTKSYTGRMHYKDFFKQLIKKLRINTHSEDLIDSWIKIRGKTSKLDKEVEKIIKALRKKYVVGCLTNTTRLNDKVKIRKEVYSLFDVKVTSLNARSKKPQLKIYKLLAKKLNKNKISLKETVFIDNEKRNLLPARKRGMKTILFKNNKQLIKDLKNLGVKI